MCLHFVRACTDDSNEKKMQANSFQGQHRSPWQNIWESVDEILVLAI